MPPRGVTNAALRNQGCRPAEGFLPVGPAKVTPRTGKSDP